MKKSRFADEQMVTILREAGKAPVAEVAKKHGISERTIYNWQQHFGGLEAAGLEAADVKRLKQFEHENARLELSPHLVQSEASQCSAILENPHTQHLRLSLPTR